MPFRKLFRSRWSALFWAGGILWFAYDVANASPPAASSNSQAEVTTDATGEAVDSADLAALANIMG